MVPRRGRVGRDEVDEADVVAAHLRRIPEVQHRREEHDAVERDAVVGEKTGETRRAGRAVALARQELRRTHAVEAREVQTNELAERVQIFIEPPEARAQRLRRRSAVAGADGVDEHEVRLVEERVRIVLEAVGRRRSRSVGVELHLLRTERAEVQPDGGRSGAAVEREGDRTRRRVRAVLRVGDVVHPAFDRVRLLVANREHAGRRRVGDRLSANVDRVVRRRRRHFGHRDDVAWRGRRGSDARSPRCPAGGRIAGRRTSGLNRSVLTAAAAASAATALSDRRRRGNDENREENAERDARAAWRETCASHAGVLREVGAALGIELAAQQFARRDGATRARRTRSPSLRPISARPRQAKKAACSPSSCSRTPASRNRSGRARCKSTPTLPSGRTARRWTASESALPAARRRRPRRG